MRKSTLLMILDDLKDGISLANDTPHSEGRDEQVDNLVHTSKSLTEALKAFK